MPEVLVVVRVWLPDRPGALGAVASRIGAVRGDVVAIDVLERGGGRAVDELTVALPDEHLVDLLVAEIGQVDGVDVEDVRPQLGGERDRAVSVLAAARAIVAVDEADDVLRVTSRVVRQVSDADWVAVLDLSTQEYVAIAGAPNQDAGWLSVFIAGAQEQGAIDELAFCPLEGSYWLVVARGHLPLREVERQILDELAALSVQSLAHARERSTARSH